MYLPELVAGNQLFCLGELPVNDNSLAAFGRTYFSTSSITDGGSDKFVILFSRSKIKPQPYPDEPLANFSLY
jgi:hypothetical protein